MSEDDLLIFAAKAAGMPPPVDEHGVWSAWVGSPENGHWWNPLEDDGDAMRLVISLRLELMFFNGYGEVRAESSNNDDIAQGIEVYGDDLGAAVRRVIVKVAAEIGRSMP